MAAEFVCPAVLNIAGEHFPCQQMDQMVEGSTNHGGWAHSNRDAQAIWCGNEGAEFGYDADTTS